MFYFYRFFYLLPLLLRLRLRFDVIRPSLLDDEEELELEEDEELDEDERDPEDELLSEELLKFSKSKSNKAFYNFTIFSERKVILHLTCRYYSILSHEASFL